MKFSSLVYNSYFGNEFIFVSACITFTFVGVYSRKSVEVSLGIKYFLWLKGKGFVTNASETEMMDDLFTRKILWRCWRRDILVSYTVFRVAKLWRNKDLFVHEEGIFLGVCPSIWQTEKESILSCLSPTPCLVRKGNLCSSLCQIDQQQNRLTFISKRVKLWMRSHLKWITADKRI